MLDIYTSMNISRSGGVLLSPGGFLLLNSILKVSDPSRRLNHEKNKKHTLSIHFSTDLSSILDLFCNGPGKKGGPSFPLMDVCAGGVTPWRKEICSVSICRNSFLNECVGEFAQFGFAGTIF